ncbi:MAG: hypothetical protein MUE79_03165 [Nitratireductor sp.]|nr:hypothetical protein [Nitratireductor sp.]
MKMMLRPVIAVMAMAALVQFGHAAQKSQKAPSVTVKQGQVSTIHDGLYAWDENCRPVAIKVKVWKSSGGRLYPVPQIFRIRGKAGDACNGRMVSGRKIVFKPAPGFKGNTSVRYSIATPGTAIRDTYVFSRSIMVR